MSEERAERREAARLWIGVLAPPLVVLFSQWIAFALVPWACATGHTIVLHLVAVAALLSVGGVALVAAGELRPEPAETASPEGRSTQRARFLAVLGLWFSLFSALMIVALWIPCFILNPCYR